MKDRFGRITSHLRDESGEYPADFPTQCIAAVEDLFGQNWLEGKEGQSEHPLQKLWKRKDWLATCELFGLGKCITQLTPVHDSWLRQTARKIKSGVLNAHGFITEILVCGSLYARDGKVYPAPGNQKGFDFVVSFPSDFKYYISIKSQGMALHETKFHEFSDRLKAAFSSRLEALGLNGELTITSSVHLEPEMFEFLIKFVGQTLRKPQIYRYQNQQCEIVFRHLQPEARQYASTQRSHKVTIVSPQHRNTMLNAKTKLEDAAKNLRDHLPMSDDYFRYLWIRVHNSVDAEALQQAAQAMLDDHERDYGFDGAFFIQPSVVRNEEGSSINSYMGFAHSQLHQGFARAIVEGRVSLLTAPFPVGGLSTKPSELHVTSGSTSVPLPRDQYFYQKADLYLLMEREGEEMVGTWTSPASGIRHHLVYDTGTEEIVFFSSSAEVEETLII